MQSRILSRATALAAVALLLSTSFVWASDVNVVAVVDVTAPTGAVTLTPGESGSVTINMSVTGKQDGTATFEINRTWSLSGGTFTGSNPQTFTVAPRAARDPASTFSTTGTVTVAAGQGAGTFTLTVSAFHITNSNSTGAQLADGGDSNYSVTVSVPSDTTAPVIAAHADVTAEATSAAGAIVTYTSPATSDAVDGAGTATCTPASGSQFALGDTTVTCNATDAAGNAATPTTFKVSVRLSLKGFYQPVDMNGVYNVVKGGSTVPLKFEVFAGPTELTSTSIVKSFVQTKVACDGSSPTDEIEVTSTGGTSLRYDSTGGQFIQNWQTPKLPGQCYRVTMTTQDTSTLVAYFQLK